MILAAALAITSAPTSVLPVTLIKATCGCFAKALPVTEPRPDIQLITPSGTPASFSNSQYLCNVSGLSVDGFTITLFPIIKALGTFWPNKSHGKLNGIIQATTPNGCWTVICIVFSCPTSLPAGITFP